MLKKYLAKPKNLPGKAGVAAMAFSVLAMAKFLGGCVQSAVCCFLRTLWRAVSSPVGSRVCMVVAASFVVTSASADTADGIYGELNNMAAKFRTYVQPVQQIVYALAGICAVVGAFTIYFKMTNGDQDVKKTIMLTVGGCAALVGLATALPAMFPT